MYQCYQQDAFWVVLWGCFIFGGVLTAGLLHVLDRRHEK